MNIFSLLDTPHIFSVIGTLRYVGLHFCIWQTSSLCMFCCCCFPLQENLFFPLRSNWLEQKLIGMVAMEPEMPHLNSSLKADCFKGISTHFHNLISLLMLQKENKIRSLFFHYVDLCKRVINILWLQGEKSWTSDKPFQNFSSAYLSVCSLPISGRKKSSFTGLTELLSTNTEQSWLCACSFIFIEWVPGVQFHTWNFYRFCSKALHKA